VVWSLFLYLEGKAIRTCSVAATLTYMAEQAVTVHALVVGQRTRHDSMLERRRLLVGTRKIDWVYSLPRKGKRGQELL
jgi:hypothetical protein